MGTFEKIKKAIRCGSLNCEKHANGVWFNWHSFQLLIMPLFCSYGQMGYTIDVKYKGEYITLQYDYELNKIEDTTEE